MALLRCLATGCFSAISLVAPVQALNRGLPASYDQLFPDQLWSTYLLLDGHPGKGLVAITMGLSPRVGQSKALLPIATYSVIEPIPASTQQWQLLLSAMAADDANQVIANRARILNQR